MHFKSLNNVQEIEIMPKIKVKFIHSTKMTLAYWEIEAGAVFPDHSHPHEQVATVLDGEFEFKVGNEKKIMKKGDVAVIGSNVSHSGIALTKCYIVDVFSPVRGDYLELTNKNNKK